VSPGPTGPAPPDLTERYLGLGWIVWDRVMQLAAYPWENHKVPAEHGFGQVGGPVVRALMLLRGFGAEADLVGAVGRDPAGDRARSELAAAGVGTGRVRVDPVAPTRSAQVWLANDTGSRTVVYTPDGPELEPVEAALDGVAAVLLDGRHPEPATGLIRAARQRGVPAAMDMGGYRSYLPELIAGVDILVGSARTWGRLATELGHSEPVELMRSLTRTTCVLTDGPERVQAVHGPELVDYRPTPVRVVDSNGAGDVFFGAFVWARTHGSDLARSVGFASVAAGLKCTRLGNRGLPRLSELDY
jgi:sugar/nucleoside kinase (ribokinase family)